MTPRSLSRKGPLLRRLGLALGLILLCCLATGGVAGAAPGDLTLAINSLDLSAYPQASFVLQLGGESASNLEDLGQGLGHAPGRWQDRPCRFASGGRRGCRRARADGAPDRRIRQHEGRGDQRPRQMPPLPSSTPCARPTAPRCKRSTLSFGLSRPSPTTRNALKASLAGLNPQKETALYDALIKALASFGSASSGQRSLRDTRFRWWRHGEHGHTRPGPGGRAFQRHPCLRDRAEEHRVRLATPGRA